MFNNERNSDIIETTFKRLCYKKQRFFGRVVFYNVHVNIFKRLRCKFPPTLPYLHPKMFPVLLKESLAWKYCHKSLLFGYETEFLLNTPMSRETWNQIERKIQSDQTYFIFRSNITWKSNLAFLKDRLERHLRPLFQRFQCIFQYQIKKFYMIQNSAINSFFFCSFFCVYFITLFLL